MKIKNTKLLLFSIFISHLAGILGSFATRSSVSNWYLTLNKPFFNPPNWIFAPIWLTLYTLMGVALYLIWISKSKKKLRKKAVSVFLVHLLFNAFWSIAFFGIQNLALALLVIVILLSLIIYLIKLFWGINKRAAYMLIPYVVWVSFAALLNFSIWILN